MNAFVDRVGGIGDLGASFTPYQHMAMRGMSVYCIAPLPWFMMTYADARETSPWRVCEIHMGNARVHFYSAYFNPTDRTHRKAALLEKHCPYKRNGAPS